MSFLQLKNKKFLIFGVFNRKSIAYHAAKALQEEGTRLVLVVKDHAIKKKVEPLFPDQEIFQCDVGNQKEIDILYRDVSLKHEKLNGMLHSIAFANYSEGFKPFHETRKEDFLQAVDISCFSLINLSGVFKKLFDVNASVVTLSVPFTQVVVENYGYMTPIKAALQSSISYLAKSFSHFSNIRFNAVGAGFLKTSSAAGVPEYMKTYLYAEQMTLRKKGVETREIADVIAFLLSERSGSINGQTIIADAGMSVNVFDGQVVDAVNKALFDKAQGPNS